MPQLGSLGTPTIDEPTCLIEQMASNEYQVQHDKWGSKNYFLEMDTITYMLAAQKTMFSKNIDTFFNLFSKNQIIIRYL